MTRIGTPIQEDEAFQRNREHYQSLLGRIAAAGAAVRIGGGEKAVARLRQKRKLTARERIERLLDPGSRFLEIGLFAAWGMYEEHGGAPSAGTVAGVGVIHGRDAVVVANDATVKAGSWFPLTCKKNLRAQEISMENRLPIVYLVDSAGVYLPMQSEIFPDRDHFGRIFRNNAVMASMGIPQIAAIMGPCVAGGAYLPIMSDEALIVDGTGSVFLAGSHLVKAAIGEEIDNESLGGSIVQTEISGVTDYRADSDEDCLERIRRIISRMGHAESGPFDRVAPALPAFDPADVYGLIPEEPSRPYNTYELLARILDDSELDEYKAGFGKSMITGYGRIDGWAVGIVANQRLVVKNAQGEMQVGGVIYSDSADKAARFVMNCNQKKIPLVFLQDVTGFMVGSRAERGGIIKDGAKLVSVVANSVVPKITFIIGNSFGAGNYAMCGKAYDPRFIYAWPTARIGVMGGKQAGETLHSIKMHAMETGGKHISPEMQRTQLEDIQKVYAQELDPMFAAARLWVDDIVDPVDTRWLTSRAIGIAANNPEIRPFNPGILQV